MIATEYWQKQWVERIKDNRTLKLNKPKRDKIQSFLSGFNLDGLKKLDLGCGPCHHAIVQRWRDYTGVDLSEKATEFGKEMMPWNEFYCMPIMDIPEKKYDVFLALDALEHIELTKELAEKIRRMSNPGAIFLGNVPTVNFCFHHEEHEHNMDYAILSEFLIQCGFPIIRTECFYTEGTQKGKTVYLPFLLFFGEQL